MFNLHEVKVSFKDILKWKKDFETLLEVFRSQDYRTLDAAGKGFNKVRSYFETYFKNLKNYVSRDFVTVVDLELADYEKDKVKDTRAKLALAYDDFYKAWLLLRDIADPDRYINPPYDYIRKDAETRIDWYVNSHWRDTTASSPDIKLEKMAEKFFAMMRTVVKLYGHDEREAHINLYYPERTNFMGLSFVNNIYYPEESLQKMFNLMEPKLRVLKRLMPEVFYGPVFMEPQTDAQKNLTVGSMLIDAAGTYHHAKDRVTLYARGLKEWMSAASFVLVHELAHRYYFRFMNNVDRARWRDFFENLKTQSASDYGDQNPEEDFAEAILHYVMEKGIMKRKDVRDRVEAILKRTYRESYSFKPADVWKMNRIVHLIEGL